MRKRSLEPLNIRASDWNRVVARENRDVMQPRTVYAEYDNTVFIKNGSSSAFYAGQPIGVGTVIQTWSNGAIPNVKELVFNTRDLQVEDHFRACMGVMLENVAVDAIGLAKVAGLAYLKATLVGTVGGYIHPTKAGQPPSQSPIVTLQRNDWGFHRVLQSLGTDEYLISLNTAQHYTKYVLKSGFSQNSTSGTYSATADVGSITTIQNVTLRDPARIVEGWQQTDDDGLCVVSADGTWEVISGGCVTPCPPP